jgi:hypothetical protein
MRWCAVLVALAVLPASADAARPRARALLENHRHYTHGHDWHVQLEVDKSGRKLASVIAYSQECGDTGFIQHQTIHSDGSFAILAPLADGQGSFAVQGRFTSKDRADGTWSLTKGDCTFGGEFHAQDATGHFLLGNPYDYAPERIYGKSHYARLLRHFQHEVQRAAPHFHPGRAIKLGYEKSSAAGCPGLNHFRKKGTSMWGPVLDPMQPQSLVYWCDAQRRFRLAGMMFRARGTTRPTTFGNLIQWHKHGATRSATWMTHVWLVRDPVSAFASCAPFNAFAAEGKFSYHKYIAVPGDQPCSDTVME